MQKRLICFILVLIFACAVVGPAAAAKTGVSVTIDGKAVSFSSSDGVPFIDENSRTLVPLRVVMETYGCIVQWDQNTRTAYVVKDGVTVTVTIGQKYIRVNGMSQTIDTAAVIKDSRTYLPIRAVLEAFGAKVDWDAANRTVVVTHPAEEKNEPVNGKDGIDGKNGINGKDGVSVTGTTIDEDGFLVVTFSDGSTQNAGRVPYVVSPTITTDTNHYLASTGDDSDMTAAIQTMLDQNGVCNLGPGDYYVTGIEIPDNATLRGSGTATRIVLASSVSSGYAVRLKSYSCVKDLQILGQLEQYTPVATTGNRCGIAFTGTADNATNPIGYYRSTVKNVTIANFHGSGILCSNTGMGVDQNLHVSDVFVFRCDVGVNVAYLSEYHRWTNVSMTSCYYGAIVNGGNNNFDNCDFSRNTVGLLIDNRNGQSTNAAHGTFSACSFNHAGGNTGTAIRIIGVVHGEIFTGAQIFFGGIEIENSRGIRFDSANIGRQVPINVKNSSGVVFSNCSMYSAAANPVTESGNTSLSFTECYCLDGTVFDPLH